MRSWVLAALLLSSAIGLAQGPYHSVPGSSGTHAIHRDSSIIAGWASSCSVMRGYVDIADPGQGFVTAGSDVNGTGYADGATVSLGDSGVAILQFDFPIVDGLGPDFAVFENSFSNDFLELAKVYVSTDGVKWAEFPAHSLTPDSANIGSFGSTNAEDINNLAGKYRAQYGTPFDLMELADSTHLIDVNHINYIKLVDVVGDVESPSTALDTAGNKIVDPYPTAFPSGGFDLDGVAVLSNSVGLQNTEKLQAKVWPNPAQSSFRLELHGARYSWNIYDGVGRLMFSGIGSSEVDCSTWMSGFYFIHVKTDSNHFISKLLVQ